MPHTPEQIKRINAFLRKAEAEKKTPESYYAHIRYEFELKAWECFALLKAQFMSINPFVAFKYFCTKEVPEVEPTKDMRKCVSNALVEASKLGDIKHGEGLIQEMGANVNFLDSNGHTPLYHAVRRKRLGMANMLLNHGADAHLAGRGQDSALMVAAARDVDMAIPMFERHGVDFNKPLQYRQWNKYHLGYRKWNLYPLGLALYYGHTKTCKALLDWGASVDVEYCPKITIRSALTEHDHSFNPETVAVFKDALAKPQKVILTPTPVSTESVEEQRKTKIEISGLEIESVQVKSTYVEQNTTLTPQKITQQAITVQTSASFTPTRS